MKTTPIETRTLYISIGLAAVAIICIVAGWHTLAAVAGTGSALNLLAGAFLKKY